MAKPYQPTSIPGIQAISFLCVSFAFIFGGIALLAFFRSIFSFCTGVWFDAYASGTAFLISAIVFFIACVFYSILENLHSKARDQRELVHLQADHLNATYALKDHLQRLSETTYTNSLPINTASKNWFLRHEDKIEYGPYSLEDITAAFSEGSIGEKTELSHANLTGKKWMPAQQFVLGFKQTK